VAIVQISQITNRKGLQDNLPQLAGGELGWSVDARRLYIGNGTIQEGAPVIGNTEILTEFSPLPPPPRAIEELIDNQIIPRTIFTKNILNTQAFTMSYIIVRASTYRAGTLTVVAGSVAGNVSFTDDFTENANTGISLAVSQIESTIFVSYTSTATGASGVISYLIT
jgi:hypothetical protein